MVAWKTIRCSKCRGYGVVSVYSTYDFEGPGDCRRCGGDGTLFITPTGRLAIYPGGPFVGTTDPKDWETATPLSNTEDKFGNLGDFCYKEVRNRVYKTRKRYSVIENHRDIQMPSVVFNTNDYTIADNVFQYMIYSNSEQPEDLCYIPMVGLCDITWYEVGEGPVSYNKNREGIIFAVEYIGSNLIKRWGNETAFRD